VTWPRLRENLMKSKNHFSFQENTKYLFSRKRLCISILGHMNFELPTYENCFGKIDSTQGKMG